MSEIFKTLEVECPTCGVIKTINVPEAIFSQKKFGTIKIQVPINAVCPEHQFIVFVDTKGVIRGYEKMDIQMLGIPRKPELELTRKVNLRNLINTFGVYGIFNLLHAKIFNYPTYVLKDDSFKYSENLLNKIGDNILPEEFRGNKTIYLLEEKDINKIKVKDKNAFIMDTYQHIFQTPWTIKLKFEEEIVKRALDIIDETEQLKLLRQDISHLVREVDYAVSILQEINKIYEDELIEKIAKALNIKKISTYRMSLIKLFILRNISKKLASKIKSRVEEFLGVL